MFLFATILCLCILLNVIQDLIKASKVSQYFVSRKGASRNEDVYERLRSAQRELQNVREHPAASGEYTQTIKIMRAEQKVKDIESQIRQQKGMERLKSASTEMFVIYGAKAVISLALFIVTVRNRYEPVMIFSEDYFNFQPLTALLSLPTGVPNALSVPMWILSCNLTCRHVISLFKQRQNVNATPLSS